MILQNKKTAIIILSILILGAFLRLYHIEFGLPHSFRADEPELIEPAIFYTFEIRDIIKNNNYYKLIPISYVYGTFPAYLFTAFIMGFSRLHNIFGITFPKENMYILIRSLHAILSLAIALGGATLYKKVFKDKEGVVFALLFLVLNWKLIVLGHYANADLIITALLLFSFLSLYEYFKKGKTDALFTVITAILFGLAVGTKITSLLTLPLFLYIFVAKKDYRNFLAFLLLALGTFLITNPFSLVFSDNFVLRIMAMASKESGVVFDSVDSSPFKYFSALFYIATPFLAGLSIVGIIKKFSERVTSPFHVFLIGHIIFYLIFFSLGNRRVDRWLLPILPIVILYGTYGYIKVKSSLKGKLALLFTTILISSVIYFPSLLLGQFQRDVPKSEAYLWMRDNIDPLTTKYVITEEGLDPMNKLKFSTVTQYPIYTPEGAQFFTPLDPLKFDYVVFSSRPMQNFKRPEVIKAYPAYVERMKSFENAVLDTKNFTLIKSFTLPKPNLIPLSDVFIYERIKPTDNL